MIEPLLSDDSLLADIESAGRDASAVHLWWLGQSGYLVQYAGTRILIDPYLSDSLTAKYAATPKPHVRMTRRVIDPASLEQISIITSSHGHTDHLDAQTLRAVREANLAQSRPSFPAMVAPRAIKKLAEERWGGDVDVLMNDSEAHTIASTNIFGITAAHDRIERTEQGWSQYLGYVFEIGGRVIYHSGDTVVFAGMVEQLARHKIDVAILPINGKVGNMNGVDAARLARDIGARLVVPCHYEMFEFNTADPRDQFIPECERIGQAYRVLRAGERLTLSGEFK